jgi:hypothetical protein
MDFHLYLSRATCPPGTGSPSFWQGEWIDNLPLESCRKDRALPSAQPWPSSILSQLAFSRSLAWSYDAPSTPPSGNHLRSSLIVLAAAKQLSDRAFARPEPTITCLVSMLLGDCRGHPLYECCCIGWEQAQAWI